MAGIVSVAAAAELLPYWAEAEYAAAVSDGDSQATTKGILRCVFVAEISQEIVGFSVGRATVLTDGVLAELESVAVAATERRAGIGKGLCEAVIEWCRRLGAREIDLEVRRNSKGAIALYEALGFALAGRREGYYRNPPDDALLMRLSLD